MTSSVTDDRRDRLRDPVFWNDVTQLAKTAVAAVLAWVIATQVLSLSQSFLAPWAALLVVHATVYRTFSRGLRQVAAAVAGVLLAWGVGNVLGLDTAAVAVVIVLGLAVGALPWFGEEAITVAATAMVVLTTGFSGDDSMLRDRFSDTAIGIVVGLLVNAAVWPPLRRRTAITAMNAIDDSIGALLTDMGEQLVHRSTDDVVAAWVDRTRSLDADIDHAWSLVRQAQETGGRTRAARRARCVTRASGVLCCNVWSRQWPRRGAWRAPSATTRPIAIAGTRSSGSDGPAWSARPARRSPMPTRTPSATSAAGSTSWSTT